MSDNFYKINRGINLGPQAGEPSNPSNGDIYYDTSLNKFRKYENGSWSDLGSSNSAGSKNFITNGDAEANTLGWSTYADAAGTRPVDGTGGSPIVTFTRSTSSPLEGLGSFLFTKDAANRQGQGVSYDFTIDQAYKAKVLDIKIDYQVVSGTFVAGTPTSDSDLIVYLYDVTNATLIEPSSIKLLSNSTTLTDRFSSTFQTSATGTQYRLIVHCATTSASAYVVKFDNVRVSPSNYIYGTPITDWKTQAGVTCNLTNANVIAFSRRVGSNTEFSIQLNFTGSPAAASETTFTLPVSIDTTVLAGDIVGYGRHHDVGTDVFMLNATVVGSSTVKVRQLLANATALRDADVTNTSPFTPVNGDVLDVNFSVPVVGQSSSVQMSDQASTRIVAFKARRGTDQTGVNTNNTDVKMTFNQVQSDTHGAFNTTTNQYIVPVAGYYVFTGSVQPLNTNILAARYQLRIYKNGSSLNFSHNPVHSAGVAETLHCTSAPEYCVQGDTIELRYFGAGNNSASTITINSDATVTFLSGMLVSGPQTIAASETVSLHYVNTAGTSIAGGSGTNAVPYATKVWDSHNAWNGTTFTAPISGKYNVTVMAYYASASWSANSTASISLRKNGVATGDFLNITAKQAAFTANFGLNGTRDIELLAGDTLDVRLIHNEVAARSLDTTGGITTNYINIKRIGN